MNILIEKDWGVLQWHPDKFHICWTVPNICWTSFLVFRALWMNTFIVESWGRSGHSEPRAPSSYAWSARTRKHRYFRQRAHGRLGEEHLLDVGWHDDHRRASSPHVWNGGWSVGFKRTGLRCFWSNAEATLKQRWSNAEATVTLCFFLIKFVFLSTVVALDLNLISEIIMLNAIGHELFWTITIY